MKLVMIIGDVITIPNVGNVIVGINSRITKYDTSNLCRRGEDIFVKRENNELKFKVSDIKLSFSMSEKIIISIKLEESKDFSQLKIGDLVYKCETGL